MSRWSVQRDVRDHGYSDQLTKLHANGPGNHLALSLERWQTVWIEENLLPDLAPSGLPEGVHAAPDGTLWLLPGCALPDGWEWHQGPDDPQWISMPVAQVAGRMYEVAPVAPEPELVPLHELRGRMIPGHGAPVAHVHGGNGWTTDDTDGRCYPLALDADGTVAVLPLDGDQ